MNFADEKDPEVLGYLKQGFVAKEIASRLQWKTRTVEIRLARMREQNDCKTTIQLVAKWVEESNSGTVFRFMQSYLMNSQQNSM